MKSAAKLKWGVLSTSSTAVRKAIPALKRCENAELVAIASRDAEKAKSYAASLDIPKAYGSYDALLEDREVGAVYLPLPNGLHAEWTIRAAQAGKHVLCEKPAALSPEAAQEMVEACAGGNVLFMEGFMYRFHPQIACVKRWLAEKRIGSLRLLRISFSFTIEARHSKVRLQSSMGGGSLADVGAYGVDLSRFMIGDEPIRVFASGFHGLGASVETNHVAILDFPDGLQVILDGAFDRPRHNRCEIVGQTGVITVASPFITVAEASVRLQGGPQEEDQTFPMVDPFQLEFEHFSACVLHHEPPAITPSDTVGNARVLAALRASLGTGRPVELVVSPSLHSPTIPGNIP